MTVPSTLAVDPRWTSHAVALHAVVAAHTSHANARQATPRHARLGSWPTAGSCRSSRRSIPARRRRGGCAPARNARPSRHAPQAGWAAAASWPSRGGWGGAVGIKVRAQQQSLYLLFAAAEEPHHARRPRRQRDRIPQPTPMHPVPPPPAALLTDWPQHKATQRPPGRATPHHRGVSRCPHAHRERHGRPLATGPVWRVGKGRVGCNVSAGCGWVVVGGRWWCAGCIARLDHAQGAGPGAVNLAGVDDGVGVPTHHALQGR